MHINMHWRRIVFSLSFACCLLVASTLFSQSASKSEITPPDVIRIRMPEGKQGFQRIPGIEPHGYTFAYDTVGSQGGRLKLFQIWRDRNSITVPTYGFEWMTTSSVEDRQLYSFLGKIYRWDGSASKLVLAKDGPRKLSGEWKESRIAVFDQLNLNWPGAPQTQFEIKVKEFDAAEEEKANRLKVDLHLYSDDGLRLPDGSTGKKSEIVWMRPDEHVGSPYFDVTLERIVRPSPEEKNPGWAEFSIKPGPKATKK